MSKQTYVKRALTAAAACIALGTATIAAADLRPSNYAAGSQQFGLSMGGSPHAGGFRGTWNGVPLVFWCVELDQFFGFGNDYTYSAELPANANFGMLGQLFAEAYSTALSDPMHSAAFQLAVWEIFYDSANRNLASGQFMVTNAFGNAATVALAQGWLTNLNNFSDTYNVYYLRNGSHQNFVTQRRPGTVVKSEVPEPATLLLVTAALLLLLRQVHSSPAASRKGHGLVAARAS